MNKSYLKSKKISKYDVYFIAEVISRGFNASDLGIEPNQFDKVIDGLNSQAKQMSEGN